jgi:hypothetical protein
MASRFGHRPEEAMRYVDLDRQPDAVKPFFATLELALEGSVVEMNGKPLARMLPAEAVPARASRARGTDPAVERFGRGVRPTRRNGFGPAAGTGQRPLT